MATRPGTGAGAWPASLPGHGEAALAPRAHASSLACAASQLAAGWPAQPPATAVPGPGSGWPGTAVAGVCAARGPSPAWPGTLVATARPGCHVPAAGLRCRQWCPATLGRPAPRPHQRPHSPPGRTGRRPGATRLAGCPWWGGGPEPPGPGTGRGTEGLVAGLGGRPGRQPMAATALGTRRPGARCLGHRKPASSSGSRARGQAAGRQAPGTGAGCRAGPPLAWLPLLQAGPQPGRRRPGPGLRARAAGAARAGLGHPAGWYSQLGVRGRTAWLPRRCCSWRL